MSVFLYTLASPCTNMSRKPVCMQTLLNVATRTCTKNKEVQLRKKTAIKGIFHSFPYTYSSSLVAQQCPGNSLKFWGEVCLVVWSLLENFPSSLRWSTRSTHVFHLYVSEEHVLIGNECLHHLPLVSDVVKRRHGVQIRGSHQCWAKDNSQVLAGHEVVFLILGHSKKNE